MGSPKSVSAREAISAIKPGSTIFIGESCGEPQTLVEALAEAKEQLKGTHIFEGICIAGSKYTQLYDYFHIVTLQVTPDNRDAVRAGKVDFLPVNFSIVIPHCFIILRSALLIMVSPFLLYCNA